MIIVLLALPHFRPPQGKAKDAEAKANLHNIQLSVERFAVDHEGVYPNYLIGGSPANASGIPNTVAYSSDVLLREGYLDNYPRNPFMRSKLHHPLHLQAHLPTSITGNDPLSPGDPEGDTLGYRFGCEGNLMGQVLCDPRYEKWSLTDPLSGEVEQRDTWAIVEYPFWDMWEGNRTEPYIPGMFFYKSVGPMFAVEETEDEGDSEDQQGVFNEHVSLDGDRIGPMHPFPLETDQYIMGAYGSIRTKGKDVLGDEQEYIADFDRYVEYSQKGKIAQRGPGTLTPDFSAPFEGLHSLQWTRSTYSTTDIGGSPFYYASPCEQRPYPDYGNPNGIRDGLIILLMAGEDYIGDR